MSIRKSRGERLFDVFNLVLLLFLAFLCVFPLINVIAISMSSRDYVSTGSVGLIPRGFNIIAYKYLFGKASVLNSLFITVSRVVLGTLWVLLINSLTAYPLSKEPEEFRARTFFAYFYIITMLFGGGMIPYFLTIKAIGLYDTFWILVIPAAAGAGSAILLLNFFRGIPRALLEVAMVDGASHWTILFRIVIPLSKAVLATVALFNIVGLWNEWFTAIIFINNPKLIPLQTFLQQMLRRSLITINDFSGMSYDKIEQIMNKVDDSVARSALVVVSAAPILLLYPFMQRYFTKGIVLGSVKQ